MPEMPLDPISTPAPAPTSPETVGPEKPLPRTNRGPTARHIPAWAEGPGSDPPMTQG